MQLFDMTRSQASEIAETAAREAMRLCDQNWGSAHRLLVWRAKQDPRLREAIEIYCQHLKALSGSEPASHC